MIESFYINIMSGKMYANVKDRKKGSLIYGDKKGYFVKLNRKKYYFNEKEEKRFNDFIKNLDEQFDKLDKELQWKQI